MQERLTADPIEILRILGFVVRQSFNHIIHGLSSSITRQPQFFRFRSATLW